MNATRQLPKAGFLIARESDVIYPLTDNDKLVFNKLWLYPASGRTAGGKLVLNGASVFVGTAAIGDRVTADELAPTDLPIKIELPPGQVQKLEEVIFQGTAGDGVFFKYWET